MVSASKAARLEKRGAQAKKPRGKEKENVDSQLVEEPATKDTDAVAKLTEQMDKHGLSDRVTTGVLSSLESSRDIKITSASLVFHGKPLINDCTIEINFGRRYGLLGENGCGKSTLLRAIAAREYPIPSHIDVYLLNEGAPPSDLGALEWVLNEAKEKKEALERQSEELMEQNGPEDSNAMDLVDVSFD